jgi:hypothetical protein
MTYSPASAGITTMHDREPVGQAVNAIISALEIIAKMTLDETTYDEVAADEAALWTAKNQIEWILSYIREKQDDPINAVIRRVQ